MSRSRFRSENVRLEFRDLRIESVVARDEKELLRLTSRAARTGENCGRRVASGTRPNRTEATRAGAAVVAGASKKYRTAERGCAGKTSIPKVFGTRRARAAPARPRRLTPLQQV